MSLKRTGKHLLKAGISTLTGGVLLMLLLSVSIAAIGVMETGSITAWNTVLQTARLPLFLFRLLLYAGLGVFCWHIHTLYQSKGNAEGQSRIKRIGYNGTLIIVLIELLQVMPEWLLGGSNDHQ